MEGPHGGDRWSPEEATMWLWGYACGIGSAIIISLTMFLYIWFR